MKVPMSPREYDNYSRTKNQEKQKIGKQSFLQEGTAEVDNAILVQETTQRTDALDSVDSVGGIDFNQAHLNLQIRRDGKGVPLPAYKQPLESIQVHGFIPIILRIQPFVSPAHTPAYR